MSFHPYNDSPSDQNSASNALPMPTFGSSGPGPDRNRRGGNNRSGGRNNNTNNIMNHNSNNNNNNRNGNNRGYQQNSFQPPPQAPQQLARNPSFPRQPGGPPAFVMMPSMGFGAQAQAAAMQAHSQQHQQHPFMHPADHNQNPQQQIVANRMAKEKPCRTLFIRNINYESDGNELKSQFMSFGEIKTFFDIIANRGMIFITYYDLRQAESAREGMQGYLMAGRPIDVHFSLPRADEQNQKCDRDKNQGSIFVQLNSKTSTNIDEQALRSRFEPFGEIRNIRVNRGRMDQRFVEFFDTRATDNAIESLDEKPFQDGTLSLQYSWDMPNSAPERPRDNYSQQSEFRPHHNMNDVYNSPASHSPHPPSHPSHPPPPMQGQMGSNQYSQQQFAPPAPNMQMIPNGPPPHSMNQMPPQMPPQMPYYGEPRAPAPVMNFRQGNNNPVHPPPFPPNFVPNVPQYPRNPLEHVAQPGNTNIKQESMPSNRLAEAQRVQQLLSSLNSKPPAPSNSAGAEAAPSSIPAGLTPNILALLSAASGKSPQVPKVTSPPPQPALEKPSGTQTTGDLAGLLAMLVRHP